MFIKRKGIKNQEFCCVYGIWDYEILGLLKLLLANKNYLKKNRGNLIRTKGEKKLYFL